MASSIGPTLEVAGSEVGERGGAGLGHRSGIRNRDACSAMVLYVGTLSHKAIGADSIFIFFKALFCIIVYSIF